MYSLARHENRQRPAGQQLEVPHDHHAGDHDQAVDQRVHQGAQPAVLAGDAGRDPVQVVRRGREHVARRTEGLAPVVARTRRPRDERAEQRDPRIADQVRDGERAQRRARARLRRLRPAAPQAEQAAGAAARPRASSGQLVEQGAERRRPRRRSAPSASRCRGAPGPRAPRTRGCACRRPRAAGSRAAPPPRTSRPGSCRGRRRARRARPRAARRRGAPPARARRCRACPVRPGARRRARSSAATRCRARPRTARPRPPRSAPARCRSCPSRSGAPCPSSSR